MSLRDADYEDECDHPDEYHAARWDETLEKYWIICTLCQSRISIVNSLSDFMQPETYS